jgi:DNA gyrase subunit A
MVELLRRYNEHQLNILRRRSEFDLARARERLHIVEGLVIGAVHADEIVKIFQAARDRQVARAELVKRFKLSEVQAQRISEMTLAQVTRMDLAGYRTEKNDLQERIAYLVDLLAHHPKMVAAIKDEMQQIINDFADDRRTAILSDEHAAAAVEDVPAAIESKPVLVALTNDGGIKAMPSNTYAGKTNSGTASGSHTRRAGGTRAQFRQPRSGRARRGNRTRERIFRGGPSRRLHPGRPREKDRPLRIRARGRKTLA